MSERGRSTQKQGEELSAFYRQRFGSHSPEEYMNLRISGFDGKLERNEIKELLSNEFRKYEPFEIKVVRNPGDDERLAYVNFERRECAKNIRYKLVDKLRRTMGRNIICDPAGILRDQEGKYIPDRFNRALQKEAEQDRSGGSGRRSPTGAGRSNGPKQRNDWKLKENDADATRTLFVGNMPANIRENEIRKVFERYGRVEDIDIKTPANTDAAYAFVMFQSVDQAIDAKNDVHDRPIRPGTSRCKIGYGKSQVSRRLWVGGLGPWACAEILLKEFDRYGLVEKLEYDDGDDVAYIRYADTAAASEACRAMKNYPLGGRDRLISVDFAKDTTEQPKQGPMFSRKRKASQSPPPPLARCPPGGGSPKPQVRSFEDLDEEYATTWRGQVILKKNDYNIDLYRIYGAEKLLQRLLRDKDGDSLSLHLTQRVGYSSQEGLLDRLSGLSSRQLCLSVAVGKPREETRPLVKYLTEKDAAGVVSVPDASLYIFPYCAVALKLLSQYAPSVRVLTSGCHFLLFALAPREKSNSSSPR